MNRQFIKKLFTLTVTFLIVAAGVWASYQFGPKPAAANTAQTPPKVALTQPTSTIQPVGHEAPPNPFQQLLGLAQTSMKAAEVAQSPEKYLEFLQKLYVSRGYQTSQAQISQPGNKNSQQMNKFYWLEDSGNFKMICAVGVDANPNTNEITTQPQIYATVISPNGKGGSRWLTLRYDAKEANSVMAQKAIPTPGDMPGEDPRGVPRAAGLRRLLSVTRPGNSGTSAIAIYTTTENSESLNEWYLKAMSFDWQLDSFASAQAKSIAGGISCFVRGERSCMVWIEPATTGQQTFVIISANQA